VYLNKELRSDQVLIVVCTSLTTAFCLRTTLPAKQFTSS